MALYGTTVVILSDLRDIGAGLSGNLKKICHPLIADRSLSTCKRWYKELLAVIIARFLSNIYLATTTKKLINV